MRLKSEVSGIPLSSYEFALLCCMAMAEDGASAPELVQYMWSAAGLKVSGASAANTLKRMEELGYVTSRHEDVSGREGRMGPSEVKYWIIIGNGRDALRDHDRWYAKCRAMGIEDAGTVAGDSGTITATGNIL